jgi:hypothetical protein
MCLYPKFFGHETNITNSSRTSRSVRYMPSNFVIVKHLQIKSETSAVCTLFAFSFIVLYSTITLNNPFTSHCSWTCLFYSRRPLIGLFPRCLSERSLTWISVRYTEYSCRRKLQTAPVLRSKICTNM